MAAPSMTFNATGNALASQVLGAGATVTFDVDLSAKFQGWLTVKSTGGGTVASTSGTTILLYPRYGGTPTVDTRGRAIGFFDQIASTTKIVTLPIPTGKWRIALVNNDVTNAITVEATLDTVDGVT